MFSYHSEDSTGLAIFWNMKGRRIDFHSKANIPALPAKSQQTPTDNMVLEHMSKRSAKFWLQTFYYIVIVLNGLNIGGIFRIKVKSDASTIKRQKPTNGEWLDSNEN